MEEWTVVCVPLQDCQVFIWSADVTSSSQHWTPKLLHKFNDVVWHLSWSVTGNILAVSGGDNKVGYWQVQWQRHELSLGGGYSPGSGGQNGIHGQGHGGGSGDKVSQKLKQCADVVYRF